MRLVLSLAASVLMLAGCANGYDKAAELPACGRLAGRSVALQVSGPGLVLSGGFVIPGRNLGGSGKLDMEWGNPPACIRQEQTPPAKSYDLQKVGMVL